MEKGGQSKDVPILGDGEQTRDFVFVKDVARAIATALLQESPKGHAVYNVCTGKTITINQLAEMVVKLWGDKTTSKVVHREARDGDIKHSACAFEAANQGLKFKSKVKVEDGLAQTLEWFKEKSAATAK